MDKNECKFSGKIERLQEVNTNSGTRMARWLLHVGQDHFRCVAFRNVAEEVLQCIDGDRLTVTGSGAINSYEVGGHWRNDFQVSAWTVEIDGRVVVYEKAASLSVANATNNQADAIRGNSPNKGSGTTCAKKLPQPPEITLQRKEFLREHRQRPVADFEGMPF